MISKSRPINLVSKLNPEVFKILNKDVFGTVPLPLGSGHSAVAKIISPRYEEMLKVIMPGIISRSPNDDKWYAKVKEYWDSFGIKVPVGGVLLETGFTFDLNDVRRQKALTELKGIAKAKDVIIDSEEKLANFVLSSAVAEEEKYKYGHPIHPEQYLTWTFCLGHPKVANHVELLNKSTNIEFILINPKDIEDTKRTQHTLSVKALEKYIEVLADRSKTKDILYVEGVNVSAMDDIDIDSRLKVLVDTNPKRFLEIFNDTSVTVKARIERYCVKGILKRLQGSSIIVDANDTGVLIGNTLDEAVLFFTSEAPDRVAKVKEFKTRYSQTKETIK